MKDKGAEFLFCFPPYLKKKKKKKRIRKKITIRKKVFSIVAADTSKEFIGFISMAIFKNLILLNFFIYCGVCQNYLKKKKFSTRST